MQIEIDITNKTKCNKLKNMVIKTNDTELSLSSLNETEQIEMTKVLLGAAYEMLPGIGYRLQEKIITMIRDEL
jgi:hypothetical protein